MSLTITGLRASYGSGDVLHDVSLTVAPGTVTALVGPNGAGKTTLLRVVSGLLRPRAGTVTADGVSLAGRDCARRVRGGIVMVPEGRQVFGGLSVTDNIVLGAWASGAGAAERRQRLDTVWDLFGDLAARREMPAGLLSGGQQQMVAIGRGLAAGPRYLLLDEPSLGLAPMITEAIFGQITELAARGIGVLVVEQNATVALAAAGTGYLLEGGEVAAEGPDLLEREDLAQRYFGVLGVVRGDGAPAMTAALRAALADGDSTG